MILPGVVHTELLATHFQGDSAAINVIIRRHIQTFRQTFFLVFDCEIRSRNNWVLSFPRNVAGVRLCKGRSQAISVAVPVLKENRLFTHHLKINKRLHAHGALQSHKLKLNQTALQTIFKCTAHLPHSFDLLSSFFGVGRISYFSCVVLNCPLAQLRVTEMKTITHA